MGAPATAPVTGAGHGPLHRASPCSQPSGLLGSSTRVSPWRAYGPAPTSAVAGSGALSSTYVSIVYEGEIVDGTLRPDGVETVGVLDGD